MKAQPGNQEHLNLHKNKKAVPSRQAPTCLENEDVNSDDPKNTTYLCICSQKDFREEIWKLFIECKESME